jgi:hypothetical protein
MRALHRVQSAPMTKDHTRDEARSLADRLAVLKKARTAILARMPQPRRYVLALHLAAAKRYAAKVVEIRTALTTPMVSARKP